MKVSYKILSVILSCAIILPFVVQIFNTTAEGIRSVDNYPALKGFTDDLGPDDTYWQYDIVNYGLRPDLKTTTEGFKAPSAVWDGESAEISWSAYSGASSYQLNIYSGSELIKSENLTDTSYTTLIGLLEGGANYQIQVLALDATGASIAASGVLRFNAVSRAPISYMVEDFDGGVCEITKGTYATKTLVNGDNLKYADATAFVFKITVPSVSMFTPVFYTGSSTDVTGSSGRVYGTGGYGGEQAKNYQSAEYADRKTNIYRISVDNPFEIYNWTFDGGYAADKRISFSGNDSCKTYTGGYYLIIPLDIYTDDLKQDIKSGTFKRLDVKVNAIKNLPADTFFAVDSVQMISNIDGFIKQLQAEYNCAYDYVEGPTEFEADTYDTAQKYLYNEAQDAGYIFNNNANGRYIRFKASSVFTTEYGARLSFTAPKDGTYDLANVVNVVDNSVVTAAEVNYRVVKVDNQGVRKTVYPFDGSEWYTERVTEDNMNPSLKFASPAVELKTGEKMVIEAYVHDLTNNGIELTLNLGVPTATYTEMTETYKGAAYQWKYSTYTPFMVHSYEDIINSNNYSQNGRWTARLIEPDGEDYKYSDFVQFNNYKREKTTFRPEGGTPFDIGYYFYMELSHAGESGLQLGNNYGVSFEFSAPISGKAQISAQLGYNKSIAKYRIRKNDETIYPENGGWYSTPYGNSVVDFFTGCDVEPGDKIYIDYVSEESGSKVFSMNSTPMVTITPENESNSPTDTTFSPLWERPYQNTDYSGGFTHLDASPWRFKIHRTEDVNKPLTADMYNSASNELYSSDASAGGTAYIFEDDELKFRVGNEKRGMALEFIIPNRAYYDFSTAIKVLSGEKKVHARLMQNDTQLWPQTGWQEIDPTQESEIDFYPIEINGDTGDVIKLQIYTDNLTEGEEPVVISLGTPLVKRLSNRTFTDSGSLSHYAPIDYPPFESGYNGSFMPIPSRFSFTFADSSGNVLPITQISDTQKVIKADSNNLVSFKDDLFKIKLGAGNTATIDFTSPADAEGTVELSFTGSQKAEVKVVKNDEVVFDLKETDSITLESLDLKKNDKLSIIISSQKANELVFTSFDIALSGAHYNANTATDDTFYAIYANPYGTDTYSGNYTETDAEYWKFRYYDGQNDQMAESTYYDSDLKRLSLTKDSILGYNFNSNVLTADMKSGEENGIALGFEAPRSDTYNFRTGISLYTENASATLKMRLIKLSADGKSFEKIWPDSEEWYTDTFNYGEDTVKIPYAAVELENGESVYFEVTASDYSGEKLTLNLVSPAVRCNSGTEISNMDIVGEKYWAESYIPYSTVSSYNGKYIPMEDRWNFEFINVDAENSKYQDKLPTLINNVGGNKNVYSGETAETANYSLSSGVVANLVNTADSITGVSLRFIVPQTGKLMVSAVPYINEDLLCNNASVYYRVVKRTVDTAEPTETVIWPNNGIDSWEKLTNEDKISDFIPEVFEGQVGDEILIQLYMDAPQEDKAEYFSANTLWQNSVKIVNSCICVIEYAPDYQSIYNASQFWDPDVTTQFNPFWTAQFATDSENPNWKTMVGNSWGYISSLGYNIISVNRGNTFWIQNRGNGLEEFDTVSACLLFKSPMDGFISGVNSNVVNITSDDGVGTVRFRITQNGETVYPEGGGWSLLDVYEETPDIPQKMSLKDISIAVKAGDQIRFEVSTLEHIPNQSQVYVNWVPSLNYTLYENVYLMSDDIYNYLDAPTKAYFMALAEEMGDTEFDPDLDGSYAEAQAAIEARDARIAAYKAYLAALENSNQDEEDNVNGNVEDDVDDDNVEEDGAEDGNIEDGGVDADNVEGGNAEKDNLEEDNTEEVTEDDGGTEDTYTEWIEEIITPGGRRKRIIRRISPNTWLYVGIIGGSVVGLAAVITAVLLILKKKGKIFKKKDIEKV